MRASQILAEGVPVVHGHEVTALLPAAAPAVDALTSVDQLAYREVELWRRPAVRPYEEIGAAGARVARGGRRLLGPRGSAGRRRADRAAARPHQQHGDRDAAP